MTPKEKAKELVDSFTFIDNGDKFQLITTKDKIKAKQCALIAVENEYHSLREQLINLRACAVIESEKVYLVRLQQLIDEEKEVKQEIEKL